MMKEESLQAIDEKEHGRNFLSTVWLTRHLVWMCLVFGLFYYVAESSVCYGYMGKNLKEGKSMKQAQGDVNASVTVSPENDTAAIRKATATFALG